jgi:hypothetical protein
LICSAVLIVSMVALSLWAVTVLHPGTQVAIHWGPGGVPNNFASISVALSIGPLIALVLSTAFAVIWLRLWRRTTVSRSRRRAYL